MFSWCEWGISYGVCRLRARVHLKTLCSLLKTDSFTVPISFPEPTCRLVSSKTRSSAIIKFPYQDFRSSGFTAHVHVCWFTKWAVISLYPSMIVSLWDFSPKSEMRWSIEPKGLQQQRQTVYKSSPDLTCLKAIFLPVIYALAREHWRFSCCHLILLKTVCFGGTKWQPEIRLRLQAIYAWAVW